LIGCSYPSPILAVGRAATNAVWLLIAVDGSFERGPATAKCRQPAPNFWSHPGVEANPFRHAAGLLKQLLWAAVRVNLRLNDGWTNPHYASPIPNLSTFVVLYRSSSGIFLTQN
jgi:hypothetical protein